LVLLSFVSGLGGIRQLAITHCPLIGCIILHILCSGIPLNVQLRRNSFSILLALIACVSCCLGFLINKTYLSTVYSFFDSSSFTLGLMDPSSFNELVYSFFHQFGWRRWTNERIIMLLFSYAGLFVAIWCVICGIRNLFHISKTDSHLNLNIVRRFFPVSLLIILIIFIFTTHYWHYSLYFIPVIVWIIPMICIEWQDLPDNLFHLSFRHICFLLVLFLMLCNSGINGLYFKGFHRWFPQSYEGLAYTEPDLVQKLEGSIRFLKDNNYTYGYSTFWNSNVVTELTDGEIRMSSIQVFGDGTRTTNYEWLTLRSYDDIDVEKTFMLVEESEQPRYPNTPMYSSGQLVYRDQYFHIYHFDDPDSVRNTLLPSM